MFNIKIFTKNFSIKLFMIFLITFFISYNITISFKQFNLLEKINDFIISPSNKISSNTNIPKASSTLRPNTTKKIINTPIVNNKNYNIKTQTKQIYKNTFKNTLKNNTNTPYRIRIKNTPTISELQIKTFTTQNTITPLVTETNTLITTQLEISTSNIETVTSILQQTVIPTVTPNISNSEMESN